MDFTTIGRLNRQIKNMGMEMKWNQKKKSGHISPEERYIEAWREQQRNRDTKLEGIYGKLYSGKELTAEEMQYLEQKNPQAYQKAKEIAMEKEGYEKALKRCKTKEDVERLKTVHVSEALSSVKSVMNNPVIPEGKKLELVMQIKQKMAAIEEATQKFVESGRYHELPTEAEQRKAEQDMAEAERAEKDMPKVEKAETSESGETADALEEVQSVWKETEISKAEAEQTPEAKKVKLAKAKKDYRMFEEETYEAWLVNAQIERRV